WKRLCEVIGQPALARDPDLAKASDRVRHRARADAAIEAWISCLRADEAAQALQAHGIAAGPVVAVNALAREPNIAHRGLYKAGGMRSAIRYFDTPAGCFASRLRHGDAARARAAASDAPLAGVRVLELGQYTTAPLVARNLGALGADVLKIEPPGGDAARE